MQDIGQNTKRWGLSTIFDHLRNEKKYAVSIIRTIYVVLNVIALWRKVSKLSTVNDAFEIIRHVSKAVDDEKSTSGFLPLR